MIQVLAVLNVNFRLFWSLRQYAIHHLHLLARSALILIVIGLNNGTYFLAMELPCLIAFFYLTVREWDWERCSWNLW